ncbi:ABC transporter substrate-binding protein [Caulobacter sp. 17J80-11]|uniref:ABC transporter substrate-binding protein n=1 Tax=Caulobacter sp. 17J80-11 TaxID=2763502 RepID=UPI00351C3B9C
MKRFGLILAASVALAAGAARAGEMRVLSLDSCADQYVVALAPREAIVGVSPRADDDDSWMKAEAKGLPQRRPTLEAALAARPTLVVRFWGGDERLVRALEARGAKVVGIDDASDFDGVRADVRKVAAAMGRQAEGEKLVARMDAQLAASRGAWKGEKALYLTPGGFTAGDKTLIGAMLNGAGLKSASDSEWFDSVSLEKLVLDPPRLLVLGFFDAVRGGRWAPGRDPLVGRLAKERSAASLPGSILGCPGWFVTEGSARLAAAAPKR